MHVRIASWLWASLAFAVITLLSAQVNAQSCGGRWLEGNPASGVTGSVNVVTNWDPDGPGPRKSIFVLGGDFYFPLTRLAGWDPETGQWLSFGFSSTDPVHAILPMPNGDLIVAGDFLDINGVPFTRVALWSTASQTFTRLGSGVNGPVFALARLPDGDIVAGGSFNVAGGNPTSNIARWDVRSRTWNALSAGTSGAVRALSTLPNGDLIVGGAFTSAGGAPASRIARWNQSANEWTPMGLGASSTVMALLTQPNGDLVACGLFATIDGVACNRIARLSSQTNTWAPLGSGLGMFAYALASLPNGDIVVGGQFNSAGGQPASCIARWNNQTQSWTSIGTGVDALVVAAAANQQGDLLIAGQFRNAGQVALGGVAVWRDGENRWQPLGSGFNGSVNKLVKMPNGDIVAAGGFTNIGDTHANYVARWSAATSAWSDMGNGLPTTLVRSITDIHLAPDGRLLAACNQFIPDPGARASVHEWFQDRWQQVGPGIDAYLYAVAGLGDARVACGGYFGDTPIVGVAIFNPDAGAWTSPADGIRGTTRTLLTIQGSEFLAGYSGVRGLANYGVLRWLPNERAWSPLGGGLSVTPSLQLAFPTVVALARYSDGDIVAGGLFDHAGGLPASNIARWDEATNTWSAFGNGSARVVNAVGVLPSGDVVASGEFTVPGAFEVARWFEGTQTWVSLGSDIDDSVLDVLPMSDNLVAISGAFSSVGGQNSAAFARYQFYDTPPIITEQPARAIVRQGDTLTLFLDVQPGFAGVTVQWFRNGEPISDGPGGASPDGGIVTGASRTLTSPTNGAPITLEISGAKPEDNGAYSIVLSNACGMITSDSAEVRVCPACAADFDSDGGVTGSDLEAFLVDFESGHPCADVDADGSVTNNDFGTFFATFESGGC